MHRVACNVCHGAHRVVLASQIHNYTPSLDRNGDTFPTRIVGPDDPSVIVHADDPRLAENR